MFRFIAGRTFAPEGPGAGDGGAGGGEGGAHPAAPWAAATDGAWKIGEGDKATEWWNAIPEPEAREHVIAKGYKNPAELALANYSLTKLQRTPGDFLPIPGKDAKPEDWDAVYTKLGRPEAPDKYELKFGEGVEVDPTMLDFGKKLFHKAGATPAKAQELADMWNGFVKEQNLKTHEAFVQENNTAVAQLENKWGAQLNEHKAAGERVIKALGLTEDSMAKIEGAVGAAPMIELMAMIGMKSAEGKLVGGQGGGDPNDPASMSKEQAQAKINELNGDGEFQKKYLDGKHPGHAEAVALMAKLFAKV